MIDLARSSAEPVSASPQDLAVRGSLGLAPTSFGASRAEQNGWRWSRTRCRPGAIPASNRSGTRAVGFSSLTHRSQRFLLAAGVGASTHLACFCRSAGAAPGLNPMTARRETFIVGGTYAALDRHRQTKRSDPDARPDKQCTQ